MILSYCLLLFTTLSLAADTANLAATRTLSATDIAPLWSCWFHSYVAPNITVTNLVYSYNNTQDFDIAVALSPQSNNIVPVQFNAYQPILFKSGVNLYSFVLSDTRRYLASSPSAEITWTLGDSIVTVSASSLVNDMRCDVAFNGTCPTWITGFCDDTQFCNGAETCFTPAVFLQLTSQVLGRCRQPAQGVQCSVSEVCDNEVRACVLRTAPPPPPASIVPLFQCWTNSSSGVISLVLGYNNTGALMLYRGVTLSGGAQTLATNQLTPDVYNSRQLVYFQSGVHEDAFTLVDSVGVLRTGGAIAWLLTDQSLTLSGANLTDATHCETLESVPTEAPSAEPTPAPTHAPTSEGEVYLETQCSLGFPDCSPYDTFCYGTTTCDTVNGYCVLDNPEFTPCTAPVPFIRPGVNASWVCVEQTSLCVVQITCFSDLDCNNGVICDGKEICVSGSCFPAVDQSLEAVCQGSNFVCIEGEGCMATNLPDGHLLAGVLVGVFVVLVAVGMFFYFYLRRMRPPTESLVATGKNKFV